MIYVALNFFTNFNLSLLILYSIFLKILLTVTISGSTANSIIGEDGSENDDDFEMEPQQNEDPLRGLTLHQLIHLGLILNLKVGDLANNRIWLKNIITTEINRIMKDDQEFINEVLKSLRPSYCSNIQRYQEITGMPFINGSRKRKEDTQTCCISSLMNALLNIPTIKEIVLNYQDYDCPILSCLASYLLKPKHQHRTVVDLLKTLKTITDANKAKNVEIKAQNREIMLKNLSITDESKKFANLPLLPDRYMFVAGRQEDPSEILSTLLNHCEPLRQIMMFKQRTMYTCSKCKYVSWSTMNEDDATMMHIDMVGTPNNFENLFRRSQSTIEKIKKICYHCPKKENVDHDKMVVYYQGPKVLAISLKRWVLNPEKPLYDNHDNFIGYDSDKISTPINLPNASKFQFAGKDFQIASAITHHGDVANQGHYTSHILENNQTTNHH